MTLIIINVVVFVVQLLFIVDFTDPETGQAIRNPTSGNIVKVSQLAEWGAVNKDTLLRPWMWWQLVTYGFLHDFQGVMHILFNMIGLFFFGRIVEQRIGRMEFLRFYLLAIVAGGIVGAVTNYIAFQTSGVMASTIGASGAVVATVILFACYYPNQEIYLMMVLPIKAWIAAVGFVAIDLLGAIGFVSGMGGANVAFTVHLAGAAIALAYYFQKWNLRWLAIESIADLPATLRKRARRAKLKIHDPDKKLAQDAEDADRILAKIHEFGESSLTSSERKTLERYSRRQREKRDQ
ncbi:rhomboid family intramembrane serine protease [Rubripirellula amarantea]|nr:rhomboid family intramembrane serine protease [Rubripirellula amarantea]MDA8743136.1 rhomboid family intramembrane serine protease [Rubripirellula amarantea]